MKNKSFAHRIGAAKRMAGLTNAEIATACSVSVQTVSAWLNGVTPSRENAKLLAAVLRVDVLWLEGIGSSGGDQCLMMDATLMKIRRLSERDRRVVCGLVDILSKK